MDEKETARTRWNQEIEKWDQYYATLPVHKEETEITSQFGLELLDKITSFLPAGSNILEAGCGGGWQSLALARSGKFHISLLDFSREALLYALAEHGIAATGRSGFNVWVPVPDEASVANRLLHAGWAVAQGARYRIASPTAIRITCAALPETEAPRLAAAVAQAFQPVRRARVA